MSSSTSSSRGSALRFVLGVALGVVAAWVAVWLVDRTGAWDWLGVDPDIAKWAPADPRAEATAIAYRRPRVPTGRHFARRAGPLVEEGPLLADAARRNGFDPAPYRDLAPVRVEYGRLGFRSELPAVPGGTAVVGSSYVEAGFAEAGETIPGWLVRDHGIDAANFGVAFTGGLAVRDLLERFVVPTRPRHVVWVFAARADFGMLVAEQERVEAASEARLPPLPALLVDLPGRFLGLGLRGGEAVVEGMLERVGLGAAKEPFEPPPLNRFRVGDREVPVHLSVVPRAPLERSARPILHAVLEDMRRVAEEGGADFSVVYLPTRHQLFRGRGVAPTRLAPVPDLSFAVAEACARHGIPFADATPALDAALDRGVLVVNPLWDQHLNAAGMRIVADEIAGLLEGR